MRTLFSGERIFEATTIVVSTAIVVGMVVLAVDRINQPDQQRSHQLATDGDNRRLQLKDSASDLGAVVDRNLNRPLPNQKVQRRGMVEVSVFISPAAAQRVPLLRGDLNCDGVVDALDTKPFLDSVLIGDFNEKADLNGDNVVDLLDLRHCKAKD